MKSSNWTYKWSERETMTWEKSNRVANRTRFRWDSSSINPNSNINPGSWCCCFPSTKCELIPCTYIRFSSNPTIKINKQSMNPLRVNGTETKAAKTQPWKCEIKLNVKLTHRAKSVGKSQRLSGVLRCRCCCCCRLIIVSFLWTFSNTHSFTPSLIRSFIRRARSCQCFQDNNKKIICLVAAIVVALIIAGQQQQVTPAKAISLTDSRTCSWPAFPPSKAKWAASEEPPACPAGRYWYYRQNLARIDCIQVLILQPELG